MMLENPDMVISREEARDLEMTVYMALATMNTPLRVSYLMRKAI